MKLPPISNAPLVTQGNGDHDYESYYNNYKFMLKQKQPLIAKNFLDSAIKSTDSKRKMAYALLKRADIFISMSEQVEAYNDLMKAKELYPCHQVYRKMGDFFQNQLNNNTQASRFYNLAWETSNDKNKKYQNISRVCRRHSYV